MVDSVKNYGIAGVSTTLELGKQGAVLDASDSAIISLKDKDGALEEVAIANGTASSHAVTKAQLDASSSQKLKYKTSTVNYNSGTTAIGTAGANTTIQKVVVEKTAGNWTDANATTEIIVGDTGDTDRLFAGFDPTAGQITFDADHTYASSTVISSIVTQGGASAGSATITIWYSGTLA
jgi:hypothetical protein